MNPIQYFIDMYREALIALRRELAINACLWGNAERERKHTLAMYDLIKKRSPQQIERMEREQGLYR